MIPDRVTVFRERDDRDELLLLIGEAITDDVETYEIDHQTKRMRLTRGGKDFWFEVVEGEGPVSEEPAG